MPALQKAPRENSSTGSTAAREIEYTELFSNLKGGDLVVRERNVQLVDGRTLEVEIRALGLPNERIQVILRDITRQKEARGKPTKAFGGTE